MRKNKRNPTRFETQMKRTFPLEHNYICIKYVHDISAIFFATFSWFIKFQATY